MSSDSSFWCSPPANTWFTTPHQPFYHMPSVQGWDPLYFKGSGKLFLDQFGWLGFGVRGWVASKNGFQAEIFTWNSQILFRKFQEVLVDHKKNVSEPVATHPICSCLLIKLYKSNLFTTEKPVRTCRTEPPSTSVQKSPRLTRASLQSIPWRMLHHDLKIQRSLPSLSLSDPPNTPGFFLNRQDDWLPHRKYWIWLDFTKTVQIITSKGAPVNTIWPIEE